MSAGAIPEINVVVPLRQITMKPTAATSDFQSLSMLLFNRFLYVRQSVEPSRTVDGMGAVQYAGKARS